MGQFERAAENIIAALNRINASIQKTSVYISANTYALGAGYVINTVGVGGALGILGVTTLVPGITDGISGSDGSLSVITELISSADGISGEVAALDSQPGCVSLAAGSGDVDGFLDSQPGCVSDAEGISDIFGRLQFVLIEMAGLSDEAIGDADGFLDSQPGCVGLVGAMSHFANVSELSLV